ncbi:MAG: RNA polymerase factor sigma-54 [Chlamydiales bacterium]
MDQEVSLDLKGKQSLSMQQTQLLMMQPRMQQAITLLQAPVLQLSIIIRQELELNPLLEIDETRTTESLDDQQTESYNENREVTFDTEDFTMFETLDDTYESFFEESGNYILKSHEDEEKAHLHKERSLSYAKTLFDVLMNQARETFSEQKELEIAEVIIGSLDDKGLLLTPMQDLSIMAQTNTEQIERVLKIIQTFTPSGIAARNVRECLLIQLEAQGKTDSLAYAIVQDHYDALIHNHIPSIADALNASIEDVHHAIQKNLKGLDLRPGTTFNEENKAPIIPDVIITQDEKGNLESYVNETYIPQLTINKEYLSLHKQRHMLDEEGEKYVKNRLLAAKWLFRNIEQRNHTLKRIADYLTEKQKEFLSQPQGKLEPLILKEVAQELDLHESTIARAIANKYADTPKGIITLKDFFTNTYTTSEGEKLSSQTVKEALKKLIDQEDKHHPFSDQLLSQHLNEQGIPCARRTVAKYRNEMNIGTAQQRKRYH